MLESEHNNLQKEDVMKKVSNKFNAIVAGARNLFANAKSAVARKAGYVMIGTLGFGAPMLLATSCEKECNDYKNPDCENYDPTRVRIEALQADSTRQAQQVRDAIEPAKYNPDNISSYFDMKWGEELYQNGNPNNIVDSAKRFIGTVQRIRDEVGVPLPHNNESVSNLDNNSKTFVLTAENLRLLRGSK
jgi:hypothetical protein